MRGGMRAVISFESLVRADFDLEEIYRRADRLNLDIVAGGL